MAESVIEENDAFDSSKKAAGAPEYRECLRELAALFNWRCAPECEETNDELSIKALEAVKRFLL